MPGRLERTNIQETAHKAPTLLVCSTHLQANSRVIRQSQGKMLALILRRFRPALPLGRLIFSSTGTHSAQTRGISKTTTALKAGLPSSVNDRKLVVRVHQWHGLPCRVPAGLAVVRLDRYNNQIPGVTPRTFLPICYHEHGYAYETGPED